MWQIKLIQTHSSSYCFKGAFLARTITPRPCALLTERAWCLDTLARGSPHCVATPDPSPQDVRRTDRHLPFFAEERGPNMRVLRRVLLTYAMHNPKIGYCQVSGQASSRWSGV